MIVQLPVFSLVLFFLSVVYLVVFTYIYLFKYTQCGPNDQLKWMGNPL